jgi:hypothetical protein
LLRWLLALLLLLFARHQSKLDSNAFEHPPLGLLGERFE